MKPSAGAPVTRRRVVVAPLIGAAAALTLNSYAFAYAPCVRLNVTRYHLTPSNGEPALFCGSRCSPIRISGNPSSRSNASTRLSRLRMGCSRFDLSSIRRKPRSDWARSLDTLKDPLGVHTVLGIHDWWSDAEAQSRRTSIPLAARALTDAGLPVLENEAVPLVKDGKRLGEPPTDQAIRPPQNPSIILPFGLSKNGGLQDDHQVKPNVPVTDVPKVEFHPPLDLVQCVRYDAARHRSVAHAGAAAL